MYLSTDGLDKCNSNPCINGGSCVDGLQGYHCECVDPFVGDHCESKSASCVIKIINTLSQGLSLTSMIHITDTIIQLYYWMVNVSQKYPLKYDNCSILCEFV